MDSKETKRKEKQKIKERKRKEKQKIREYKKQLKSEIFEVENELDFSPDGATIIDCKVDNLTDIFSTYDIAQSRAFCDEFHNFLLDETAIIPMHNNLEIQIHSSREFTEQEKSIIRKTMKSHFGFYITKDIVKLRRMNLTSWILCAIGVIGLALIPWAYNIKTEIPLYEFLLIVTWFFFWEGFSLGWLDRRKVKNHRYDLLRIYNAKISFVCDEKTK